VAQSADWFEQDDFWAAFESIMFPPERFEAAIGQVTNLSEMLALRPGTRVLDLCCGPGRHSVELAQRGMIVTGVDRTARYLDRARNRAEAAGVEVELVKSDMREFVRPESFDAAINLFTSLGYFEDSQDDLKVVKNVCDSLVEGGRFVIDTIGKEIICRIFVERDWHRVSDGTIMLEERSPAPDWSRMDNTWTLIKDGQTREYHFSHRLFSAVELCELCKQAGFGQTEVFGSLARSPYDHKAGRLVVVATKT
jgi:SAM-dependent methyltransferase